MLILRKFPRSSVPVNVKVTSRYSSQTQPAVQSTQESYDRQLKDFETLGNITRKPRVKKPQKPPFVKNLFLGKFDTDILAYPELDENDTQNLERDTSTLSKLLRQDHMVKCKSLSNKLFRQSLSDYKAIGLQASQFLDGRECNVAESLKFLETLSEHDLGENILNNEQLGIQTLVKFASEKLQKKYLYPAMKGEFLTGFCLNEIEFIDISLFETKGELSKDGKTWTLNGKKSLVVNGPQADIFIVFAKTRIEKRDALTVSAFTAFLVDRNSPGLTVTKENSITESATVHFNETPVPAENVIGNVNKAEEILRVIIDEFCLSSGALNVALTKKMLNNLCKDILRKSDEKNVLYKTDVVTGKIGEIITVLYGMESILYLTAGLKDNYENQDCEIESALVKIFSSEEALKISNMCLDFLGPQVSDESLWIHLLHKQCIRQVIFPQSSDGLKIISALLGLQHAGIEWQDMVNKVRNPLFHYSYMFSIKKILRDRRNINDNPKLDLRLGDFLHPSCLPAAQYLEYCVKRLEFATEILLVRYGNDILSAHMDLRRLADIIIDIYVMTASLARASRSYCIGNQWANIEVTIATCFCNYAKERVKANVDKIQTHVYGTNDDAYRAISKKLFKFKDYYPVHPLKRNC